MMIPLEFQDILALDALGPFILIQPLAGKDLDIDNDPLDPGRDLQGGILHIARFFAEDRAQELLFGSELRLTLRGDLPNQDISWLHFRANANDPALIQVAERLFADVRDIARDVLLPQLGVARLHLELFDMDGGEGIFPHKLLADQNRILEIKAAPGHERHKDIATQG